ncbi:NADH-ubiquinone oxidoreductase-F iron-sulfur binding region domain-containing protein [Mycolicibacterium goodii]|uniref:NADH dehydrogenase n=1 Tax=Mycolicibacterium goodii TaxID=134601 RepID=A0A0K0X736_MYCGD|nr:NADH dehydrogenase [Mycolicibacterium goodii]
MTMTADLTVAAWPGITPRLLRSEPETVTGYLGAGGYRALDDPQQLLDTVEASGLLGRGGAAFPLSVKLRTVRDNGREAGGAVVIANGEEGEPASIKDRWLLRNRPHAVLDGLRLAALVVNADRAVLYTSDPRSAHSIERALAETDDRPGGAVVELVTVTPGYVAGEETAAVRVVDGGPAKPTDKPPRPFEEGVSGHPTLVSNVETLAHLAYLHRDGADAFRELGTEGSPGTFLATITGAGRPPALYELPHGVAFADVLTLHGVSPDAVSGALMGGYFAGLLGREIVGATMDHETIRGLGSGLGCGAVSVLTDDCPVAVAASVLSYFDRENAGQCGSCFNGTAAMAAVASALRDGTATADDVARLERWSVVLRGRGACATLDGACNVAASLLSAFGDLVQRHLENNCRTCRFVPFTAVRPYEVEQLRTVVAV